MSNRWKKVAKRILAFFAFSTLLVSLAGGCARHPSDEELMQLEQSREASEAAARKVEMKQKEKAQTEAKLATKKAELEEAEATKAETEANLRSKK